MKVKEVKETTDFVPPPRMKFTLASSSEMTGNTLRITSNTRSSAMKLWLKIALFLKTACL